MIQKAAFVQLLSIILFTSTSIAIAGEDSAKNKDHYTLFHPTPRAEIREFNSDRPSSVNSPVTVDAGHYYLEVELINYSHQTLSDTTKSTLKYPAPELRMGFTDRLEFQISWLSHVDQKVLASGSPTRRTSGQGDTTVRFKWNAQGNEGGIVAWAIMPGLKLPTNTNGSGNTRAEPSLLFPLTVSLGSGWGLSFMPELDEVKNQDNDSWHSEYRNPINVQHSIFGSLTGYAELVTQLSNDEASHPLVYFGSGLALQFVKSMQFDIAYNVGLNPFTAPTHVIAGWVARY